MNFETALDKYLTTPPDDGFDNWAEQVGEYISDEFYDKNERFFAESGTCNKWLNKLYYKKEMHCKLAAQLIERAAKLYKQCN